MPRIVYIVTFCGFFISGVLSAAPKTISPGAMQDRNSPMADKPQIARDLEGLDPREGAISKGLRGTFTVRHYVSGPWKGGTAIIEVAADLSYAEIRIFDVEGSLQRLYSIQPNKGRLDPATVNNPLAMAQQAAPPPSQTPREPDMSVVRSRSREVAVQAQTEEAFRAEQESRGGGGDFAQGRAGTVSSRYGTIREGSAQEAIETAERERATPKKRIVKVRKKRLKKTSGSVLDTPLSGSTESKYEYYYEEQVVYDKPEAGEATASAEKPTQVASAPPPPTTSASRRQPPPEEPPPPPSRRSSEETQVAYARPSPSSTPSFTPRGDSAPPPSSARSAYDDANLPDVSQAIQETEEEAAAPRSRGKPRESAVEDVSEAQQAAKKLESDQWSPKKTTPAPYVEEEPLPPPPTSRRKPEPVTEDISEAERAARKLDSDQWTPKATTSKPLSDAELGLVSGPAGSTQRRGRAARGGGSDDLVPMADDVRQGGQVTQGSESWSPSVTSSKLSAKEQQTLAMLNTLKTPSTSGRVTKVNRDVNNPEEGVKPFYSLEKFSGPQYGRHREFERRVMYKQNKKSFIKGAYDFYIDEVDRKAEKHYLYYYKVDPKTKKAKLIATEKHEAVSFHSNYDIASEDKGKVQYE